MPEPILQLRIGLLHIEPLIWRRIQVPGDYTFWDLHIAIQGAFAWTDTHLHEFRPWGERDGRPRFGMPLDDFEDPPLSGWEHRVADVMSPANPVLEYGYDFGDGRLHEITLEEVLATALGKKYPRCTAGELSAPPDDCGGPSGYESLLETLADPGGSGPCVDPCLGRQPDRNPRQVRSRGLRRTAGQVRQSGAPAEAAARLPGFPGLSPEVQAGKYSPCCVFRFNSL